MCGIVGFFSNRTKPEGRPQVLQALSSIQHRGPDGQGLYISPDQEFGLGHVRLAVQNLTDTGQQPAVLEKSVLAYNGEIYNFIELKQKLIENNQLKKHTVGDLPILHKGLDVYGLDFLKRLNGDYAIAFYDKDEKKLHLIRDRLGVKPLYYTTYKGVFYFASEVKAFASFAIPMQENVKAINDYLAFRYVRGDQTAFKNIFKLPPASTLTIDRHQNIQINSYWTPLQEKHYSDKTSDLYELFQDSVRLRTRAQIDIGLLLSGGVDSSLVLSEALKNRPDIIALTCQFQGQRDKDFERSVALCQKLKVKQEVYEHTSSYNEDAILAIEEPIGDSIIDPLYGLLKKSSQHRQVILTGEGADEIFAGYGHHYFLNSIDKLFPKLSTLLSLSIELMGSSLVRLFNGVYPLEITDTEIGKINRAIKNKGDLALMYHNICEFIDTDGRRTHLGENAFSTLHATKSILSEVSGMPFIKQLMYLELKTWLPNYNLLKLDKISSRHSVEARVPYLDHRIVEFVFSLPEKKLWSFFLKKPQLVQLAKKNTKIKVYKKIPFTYVDKNNKGVVYNKIQTIKLNYEIWKKNLIDS